MRIDYYYDFRSPFAYFATTRLNLITEQGAEISWRPVVVDVLLNLQENREPWAEVLDPFCPPKRAYFMADIFRLIDYWTVPFKMPCPVKPDANLAMAVAALLAQGGTEHAAFRDAVFRAVWQDQKDVSDPVVLRACLAAGGHPRGLIDQAATEGFELVTRNTVSAYGRGVFGVPTFVVGDDVYFGADRMELLAAHLRAAS